MEKNLKNIWKIYGISKASIGMADFENPCLTRAQTVLRRFAYLGVICYNASFWVGFLAIDNLFLVIQTGIFAITCPIASSAMLVPFRFKNKYHKCLNWCEDLHSRLGHYECFEKCKETSTKIFLFSATAVPFGTIVLFLAQSIIFSILRGSLVSPFFTPSPFGTPGIVFACFFQYFGTSYIIVCLGIVYSFVFLLLQHFIAILEYMQVLLKQLGPTTPTPVFKKAIAEVVEMHCQVIDYQDVLAEIAFVPILILEIMNYGLFLLIWVTIFFINDLAVLAIAASGNVLPYFLLCWMSERLIDTYDEVKETLYDLEWYRMKPKHAKYLQQIMIAVNHPKLLRAGPFHIVNFAAMGDVLQRVYSYGLIVNNIAKTNK